MRTGLVGLAALCFAAASVAANAQQTAPAMAASSAAAPRATHLTHPKTSYRDAKGHVISAADFAKAIQGGRHFKMQLSADHKRATITLLAPGASGGFNPKQVVKPQVTKGQALPAFDLPMIGGGKASLTTLHGAPTLVDLFFADCVGCIEELPAMNAYRAKHPHMHYLAITFDDAKTARAFVKQRHFAWPVAYAGSNYLNKRLKVHVYPTLFLLDSRGRLLAMHTGSMPITTTQVVKNPSHAAEGVTVTTGPATATSQAVAAATSAAARKSQVAWLNHWVSNNLHKTRQLTHPH